LLHANVAVRGIEYVLLMLLRVYAMRCSNDWSCVVPALLLVGLKLTGQPARARAPPPLPRRSTWSCRQAKAAMPCH
jgi:hypothetical protein